MTVIHEAIHTIVRMRRGRVRCLIVVRMSEKSNDANQMYEREKHVALKDASEKLNTTRIKMKNAYHRHKT
jgi:hypothetical protein